MILYVDTSAAFKLVVEEAGSSALSRFVAGATDDDLVSAWLLHTELHCAATRQAAVQHDLVEDVLARVELIDVSRFHFQRAAALPGGLRAADALHLAVALDARAGAILVYDAELAAAAEVAGLTVIAPR